ncbi:hypothetical protein GCM10027416_25990 [Okibacterium endophyticum]
MVAVLVKLRLLVLVNTLRRSPWQIVGVVIGGLYALGVIGLAVVGLVFLSMGSPELARVAVILAGSVLILGWVVIPLATAGVDQTLEPAKLATFPIPFRQLLLGLTVSGVLGIPGIVTLLIALAAAAAWWRHPLAALAAVLSAVIGVLTCVIASRAVTSLSAGLGAMRRFRELSGIIILIPIMLLGPLISALTSGLRDAADALPQLADGLAWTPLGAVWSVPGDVALGNGLEAVARLLIALATLCVLVLVWRFGLRAALVSPARSSAKAKAQGKLGFFGVFPGSPTGAVAARALTYWFRDPRYARQLIAVPLIAVLMVFYANMGDSIGVMNIAAPVMALILSITIYADISYDGTAFALHLSSGLSGVSDRAGRVIAVSTFSVPLIVIVAALSTWFTSSLDLLPGLLGISLGLMLTGFGVASVTSARVIFPVPEAGDNPFKSQPGAALPSTIATFATWGVVAVLVLPELVLAIVGFVTGAQLLGWLSLVAGIVLGLLFLVLGVRIGGRIVDRRGPELLAQLRA